MQHKKELTAIRIGKLVIKELAGQLSPAEQAELQELICTTEENRLVYKELLREEKRNGLLGELKRFDGNAAFDRFTNKINPPANRKPIKLWLRIAAGIAAIVTIAILSTYLFQKQGSSDQNITQTIKDISPGGNFATLKLADGRTISLKDQQNGTISKESGINISKTSDGQLVYTVDQKDQSLAKEVYNTITTPVGGQYQVLLPDHSTVWLNAATSITYATTLNKQGKRWVRLESGEAYFEIAKDKAHPFIVSSSGQEVTVLGTHFNINNYSNENAIKTTLLEGSVKIQSSSSTKVLKPGQQSAVTRNQIKVTPVDTEAVVAWKNGLFVFNEADVPAIMRQISRWYNVEVQYSGAIPNNLISGGIERNSNLTTAMKMLEMVGIKYQLVQVGDTKKIIIH
ncbi:FecR family protein [Pedobacter sp. MC2016-24]|uniref:FecR family protein n=1 Tax=Pedobacter sp. MC2016-24 TaxID=2780090 RepID=UPI001882B1A0|nr:FecR family protein [Pedobacter sp. MC2016-24]MBE9598673.1 FecR family protein [Pedobacter sp. MC2016-24]